MEKKHMPSVFISYSHDSPAHKQWVANLASRLMRDGIYVSIDQWDLRLGDNIANFAERAISTSTHVLVICSENYTSKSNRSLGGVGYEKTIISSEILKKPNQIKYIPIVRNNPKKELPSFLSSRLYLDFSAENEFDEQYEILLRHLYGLIKTSNIFASAQSQPPVSDKSKRKKEEISKTGKVFISYSHLDKKWLKELQIMLAPLIRLDRIQLWDDTKISAGDEWRREIDNALKETRVAVLLVTPNFLASEFIAENELPPLLDRPSSKIIQILWIAVSSSFYLVTEIAKYQACNNPAKPLDILTKPQRNKELVAICQQILDAFEK